jgi:hypothetical protein
MTMSHGPAAHGRPPGSIYKALTQPHENAACADHNMFTGNGCASQIRSELKRTNAWLDATISGSFQRNPGSTKETVVSLILDHVHRAATTGSVDNSNSSTGLRGAQDRVPSYEGGASGDGVCLRSGACAADADGRSCGTSGSDQVGTLRGCLDPLGVNTRSAVAWEVMQDESAAGTTNGELGKAAEEGADGSRNVPMRADSVKRKRRRKMKKHQWKKRRKILRRTSKVSRGAK